MKGKTMSGETKFWIMAVAVGVFAIVFGEAITTIWTDHNTARLEADK